MVLTTHLIKYVELNIHAESKANYIGQISEYYTSLLSEFYRMNSRAEPGDDSEGAQSHQADSILSPLYPDRRTQQKGSFRNLIEQKAMSTDEDGRDKTIFEKALSELRNIEYCLNFFIDIAKRNSKAHASHIHSNENMPHVSPKARRFSLRYSSYQSPVVNKQRFKDGRLLHSHQSGSSDPQPKSAMKKYLSQERRRVSFSDPPLPTTHSVCQPTSSKTSSSNSSSSHRLAKKKTKSINSPATPFTMQNALVPIGEVKEEHSLMETQAEEQAHEESGTAVAQRASRKAQPRSPAL